MSAEASSAVFHAGERAVQARVGVRERSERVGQHMIRDHLTEQHRDFYRLLPLLFVGHDDADQRPWASVLTGAPGFVTSPDPQRLQIAARPHPHDPLAAAWAPDQRLGVLGLQFETRRRNRLSGRVRELADSGLTLDVDQSFGNCPKYIQPRTLRAAAEATPEVTSEATSDRGRPLQTFDVLDDAALALLAGSDTFFVASGTRREDGSVGDGVDVSHRGGPPGFVIVEDSRHLLVPDYPGNNAYNTLGNFAVHPRAGLLFIDFDSGDLLTITGQAEIVWDLPEPALARMPGATRAWRFVVHHGHKIPGGLGQRWTTLSEPRRTR